jgi:hypothetical protein
MANYRGCIEWKEARVPLATQAPEHARKCAAPGHPDAPKLSGPSSLPSRCTWARGGITSSESGALSHHSTPIPKPSPQPVSEALEQPKVTATRKMTRPKKPVHKSSAGPKPDAGKPKTKAAWNVKTASDKLTTPTWWSLHKLPPPHSRKFLISSITFPSNHVWS